MSGRSISVHSWFETGDGNVLVKMVIENTSSERRPPLGSVLEISTSWSSKLPLRGSTYGSKHSWLVILVSKTRGGTEGREKSARSKDRIPKTTSCMEEECGSHRTVVS